MAMVTESGACPSAPHKSLNLSEDSERYECDDVKKIPDVEEVLKPKEGDGCPSGESVEKICIDKEITVEDKVLEEEDEYLFWQYYSDDDCSLGQDHSLKEVEDEDEVVEYETTDDEVDPVEYPKYIKLLRESEGYDMGDCKRYKSWMIGKMSEKGLETLNDYVMEALKGYNEAEGTQFVLSRIVMANELYFIYWITFEVTDPTVIGGEPKTLQTRINVFQGRVDVEQIRPKPVLVG